jgi:uncharacterized membrane protein YgdD (TMEM256/DUF423 family)
MTPRAAMTFAALLMALAVAAGAFGAHALRGRIGGDMISVWQTGVQYHAWHAIGLALVGLLSIHAPDRAGLALAAWLFIAGIVIFSGSLYTLALTGNRAWGAATPVGGVAFLLGWVAFAWGASR